jgi:putative membrane protein
MTYKSGETDVIKGLAAGMVAGLVGAAVMNQVQKSLGKMITSDERSHGAQSLQTGAPGHGAGAILEREGVEDESDDSTERLVQTAAVGVTGSALDRKSKEAAGTGVHYAFGLSAGAAYGLAAEMMPMSTVGAGMPYGAAIWLLADEIAVPALGLSKSAPEYSAPVHLVSFASHLVFGLTTELVRRGIRQAI